jgi:hypothetical protein
MSFKPVLVIAALGSIGCSKRIDAANRAAWNDALSEKSASDETGDVETEDPRRAAANVPQGWTRLETVVRDAIRVLAVSTDPDSIARLASKWCDVQPEARDSPFGAVWLCFPEPPILAGEQSLSLELADTGVIGFVANDLDRSRSETLSRAARQATQHLCAEPWRASADDQR